MIVLFSKGEPVSRKTLLAALGPMAEQAVEEILKRKGRIVGYLTRPDEFRKAGYAEQILFVEPENESGPHGPGKCSAADVGLERVNVSNEPLKVNPDNEEEILKYFFGSRMGTHEEIERKIQRGKGNVVD